MLDAETAGDDDFSIQHSEFGIDSSFALCTFV
jgi:hypothetical protein